MDKRSELYENLMIKKKMRGTDDLFFFNKYILESDEKRRGLLVPHVHGEWTEWYQNSKARIKMILVPRGCFKSTFFTVGRSLQAIAKNRNERILIANATLANSQRFLGEIKDHLRKNEEYKTLYGEFYDPKLRWNEDEIEVAGRALGAKEATVTAVGVGGNLVSQHYSKIICDDLVNLENSATRYQADKVIDWWKRAFSLLDYEGEMIIIGTRWSYYELYSWIVEKYPKMIDTYIRGAFLPDGSEYFPELLNKEKLAELRGLQGSYVFCNPYEAPVLMSDWKCKPIGKVKVGDEVIGFKATDTGRRTLCKSKVLEVGSRKAQTVELHMKSGRYVRCTPNHKWFTGRGKSDLTHQEYAPAKIGSKLMSVCDPYIQNQMLTEEQERLALWLGGLYDGDGGFCGGSLFLAQDEKHNPEVCRRIEEALTKLNFEWKSNIRKPKYDKRLNYTSTEMKSYWINGGMEEKRRFIIQCNPVKKEKIADKMFLKGKRFIQLEDTVLDITQRPSNLLEEQVYALQTETGNYIVWGYASSNSAFYLNDPVDEESALIKKDQIRKWGPGEEQKLPKNLNIFALTDPAISQEEGADESSIVVVGVDSENDWYVLETRTGKWTVGELIENMFAVHSQWKPITMTIETIGQAQGLMTPIHDEENRRNHYLPLVEIKSRGQITKQMRIRSVLQPRFERGKIFIYTDMYELEEQILKFPRGKRDDMIDALTDMEEVSFEADKEDPTPEKTSSSYFQALLDQQSRRELSNLDSVMGTDF